MPAINDKLFIALIVSQAAHSVEEYVFRLYEVFEPARNLSGLISENHQLGFAIGNIVFVSFGVFCCIRVQKRAADAAVWIWSWALLELANGTMHSIIAVQMNAYFPGVVTAPILIVLACLLLYREAAVNISAKAA